MPWVLCGHVTDLIGASLFACHRPNQGASLGAWDTPLYGKSVHVTDLIRASLCASLGACDRPNQGKPERT